MGTASTYEKKANLRILIVTDYMPPQTHGIAIRFRNYIDNMRLRGHAGADRGAPAARQGAKPALSRQAAAPAREEKDKG